MINLELKEGLYIRTKKGIGKIDEIRDFMGVLEFHLDSNTGKIHQPKYNMYWNNVDDIIGEPTFDLIELVEYMDLLEIENPVKLYSEDRKISLFNPVRCDGFTEFEDGTHCIILNLDYLVDIKDLKIKSVVTKEQFNSCKYVVERDK